jgi:methyl-accepting chemotaxis protein
MPNNNLDALRETASKVLLALIWLHLPLLAVIGLIIGSPWVTTILLASALAGAATLAWRLWGSSQETRLTVAVAYVGMASLVVNQLSGHAWQIDSHMYFFATLAILAAYCDWRVLLMASGAIALHHLVLNFVLPAAVYPGGGDFGRVVLHAAIVVLETAVLVWLTHQLVSLFELSHKAVETAETARAAEVAALAREATLQAEAESAKRAALNALSQRFEADVGAVIHSIVAAAGDVHVNAANLSNSAMDAAASSTRVVTASSETSMSVQTVATATQELSASISEISGQISRAATIAREAVEHVGQTRGTMTRLTDMAHQIETVVQLINGIAGQTNLLALNATIEAARAGEAGKGFAVVASEVKALATQTAKATDEIRCQVTAIQNETQQAVSAITGIAKVIDDLGGITVAVAGAVEQQGAATAEIARSAQQAAVGTESIAASMSSLARATNNTGAAAEAGRGASGVLTADCDKMTKSVRGFMETLRAA